MFTYRLHALLLKCVLSQVESYTFRYGMFTLVYSIYTVRYRLYTLTCRICPLINILYTLTNILCTLLSPNCVLSSAYRICLVQKIYHHLEKIYVNQVDIASDHQKSSHYLSYAGVSIMKTFNPLRRQGVVDGQMACL